MKSLEAIQMSLLQHQNAVIAIVISLLVMWLLRKQIARLTLWLVKSSLDESKQYIVTVVEKSVNNFVSHALQTLIVYTFTSFFVQNERLATFVDNIALTIFLLTAFRLIYELAKAIMASSTRLKGILHINIDRMVLPLVRFLTNALIFLIALISIARTWSIDLTTVFAGLGIGGLAISFAAQDSIKNLIGFIMIAYDKPFVLDEYIVTPTTEGIVEDIGLRSVKIRGLDQSLNVVPNSTMAHEPVKNWSRLEKRWFNFVVALPVTTTAEQIEVFTSEVREMLQGREHVESESVLTLFTEYDSSALNILIRCYVTLPNFAEALTERMVVNLEINRIIDRHGLRLAVPARYLTFDQVQDVTLPEQHLPANSRQHAPPNAAPFGNNVWADGDDGEVDSEYD